MLVIAGSCINLARLCCAYTYVAALSPQKFGSHSRFDTVVGPALVCNCILIGRLVKLIWSAGAANAGIPLSIIVKNYGWNAYFTALLVACGMAILLLAPMVNLKSYVQREAASKAKTA